MNRRIQQLKPSASAQLMAKAKEMQKEDQHGLSRICA